MCGTSNIGGGGCGAAPVAAPVTQAKAGGAVAGAASADPAVKAGGPVQVPDQAPAKNAVAGAGGLGGPVATPVQGVEQLSGLQGLLTQLTKLINDLMAMLGSSPKGGGSEGTPGKDNPTQIIPPGPTATQALAGGASTTLVTKPAKGCDHGGVQPAAYRGG